jgi:hypothetical protein
LEAKELDGHMSFQHYSTGLELEESYAGGCHLCSMIWQSFLKWEFKPNPTRLRDLQNMINVRVELGEKENSREQTPGFGFVLKAIGELSSSAEHDEIFG